MKDFKKDAKDDLRVNVSHHNCKRANKMVLDAYFGSFTTEYSKLEAYAQELLKSNPNSSANVELCRNEIQEGRRVFKRMYICLSACKKGWTVGCRPIISLDGCFLKIKFKGKLLVALGRDGDEQNYPIS